MANYVNGGVPGVSAGVTDKPFMQEDKDFAEKKAHAELCMAELKKVYGEEIPKVYKDFFAQWLDA